MFNKTIFKNRSFALLWSGQLVSAIGSSLQMFAVSWYIYELTGSTLAMSVSVLSYFLPSAASAPFAGVVADKHNRKKIIILCDVASAAISMAMFFWASAGTLTLFPIAVFNALQSVTNAFFMPAAAAATQSILTQREYQDSNALMQFRTRFPSVIGAFLGGVLLQTFGVEILLLINAISFLLSALSECFITLPNIASSTTKSARSSIKEALDFMLGNRILLWLVFFTMMIANGLFMSMSLYLPAIFVNTLGGNSSHLGLYYSINGVFATITALYLLGRKRHFDPYRGTVVILFLEGVTLAAHGLMPNLFTSYLLSICMGILTTACSVFILTIMQLMVPNEKMGRVQSFGSMLNNTSVPLFTLAFGVLGEKLPLQPIIFAAGIIFLLFMIPAPYIFANNDKIAAHDYTS